MRNQVDLLGIGDDDPADLRADHSSNRDRIASRCDHDNITAGQLFRQCLQWPLV
jgi:hypothetical protein